ncbi:hypothetical protein SAMD00019534_070480, partial [Acytostelium subglobosum LB1]|uniref:hypothetical protein n=1 Tax=Acytostelium subglobosum LB1 TaxID=1410327 RepID=UPI000644AA74
MMEVDRMKIGFMLGCGSNASAPKEDLASTTTTTTTNTAATTQSTMKRSLSASIQSEEDDDEGVVLLSKIASPTPSSPDKIPSPLLNLPKSSNNTNNHFNTIKIPNFSILTNAATSMLSTSANHSNIYSSSSISSGSSSNPFISKELANSLLTPLSSSSDSNSNSNTFSNSNSNTNSNNITFSITSAPNTHGMFTSNSGINMARLPSLQSISPSGSPRPDSIRSTPSGSLNNSPFLSPHAYMDAYNDDPDSGNSYPSSPNSQNSDGDEGANRSPNGSRSMACGKHSKWKKRCPDTCVGRVSPVEFSSSTRKLWTQEECCQLLEMVFQMDPQSVTAKESEQRWRSIAQTLGRTVTSTRKKYMRLMNKWSPRPMATSVHPISKLIENDRKRKTDTYDPQQPEHNMAHPAKELKMTNMNSNSNSNFNQSSSTSSSPLSTSSSPLRQHPSSSSSTNSYQHSSSMDQQQHFAQQQQQHFSLLQKQLSDSPYYKQLQSMPQQGGSQSVTSSFKTLSEKLNGTGNHASSANGSNGNPPKFKKPIGRPPEACEQHRSEHQKCPKDCPFRPNLNMHQQQQQQIQLMLTLPSTLTSQQQHVAGGSNIMTQSK